MKSSVFKSSVSGEEGGPSSSPLEIQISAFTVLKIILVLMGAYLVYRLWGIIVMVFIALVLTALIDPFADWFGKYRVPRVLAVILIYILLFGILGLVIILLVPPILVEVSELVRNFGDIWGKLISVFASVQELSVQYGIEENIKRGLESIEGGLYNAVGSAVGTIRGFFGGLVSFAVVLVLTFYMVMEKDAIRRLLNVLAPAEYHSYLFGLFTRMQQKIGLWLRGELVLMIVIGVFSYIGLLILGVDYALILALLAGFAEIIPYAGPLIAAIPAVILAFTQEPIKALFVIVLYFAIQELENNLLVPKIMQRAVGLNPVISIVALLVGVELGGVLGAILAIPVATALSVLFHDIFNGNKSSEVR